MDFNFRVIAAVLAVAGIAGFMFFGGDGDTPVPEGIVSGNGRIEAVQVDIATKIAGRVDSVSVREGDLIRPGQLLAKIDSAQLRAQLLRAEADIASAESMVAQAEAQIAQVSAQLTLAERELERSSQLLERGHTSQETFDTRLSQRDVAKANVAASKATLTSRHRGVDAAMAAKKEIETQIADTELLSPTLGRVLYRLSEPGEVLSSGGKVMTLVNLDEVYLEIFLPARAAHRLAIGSDARIVVDGADFAVPANVTFVSPTAQFTPKQVETATERDKLMFRIKVRVPTELVEKHIDFVKTGIRGVAYVRPGTDPPPWPDWLEKRFVPSEIRTTGS
ncbi:MAG: HlyD family efflux transporter periplasmic adaptor subunit [Pseudomonadota bacterium]